jgi:quinol monooxygenase YgiN
VTVLIVTGSIRVRPDLFEHALDLSLQHVRRSRTEPGCLLHSVHRDAEDPHRLVFLEHWSDPSALRAHFDVPASGAFVTELARLTDDPPEMAIYDAHPTTV